MTSQNLVSKLLANVGQAALQRLGASSRYLLNPKAQAHCASNSREPQRSWGGTAKFQTGEDWHQLAAGKLRAPNVYFLPKNPPRFPLPPPPLPLAFGATAFEICTGWKRHQPPGATAGTKELSIAAP